MQKIYSDNLTSRDGRTSPPPVHAAAATVYVGAIGVVSFKGMTLTGIPLLIERLDKRREQQKSPFREKNASLL